MVAPITKYSTISCRGAVTSTDRVQLVTNIARLMAYIFFRTIAIGDKVKYCWRSSNIIYRCCRFDEPRFGGHRIELFGHSGQRKH